MINIGLVGCGRISQNHFKAIDNLSHARCIACCDIDATRAKQAAKTYNIPFWTTNYEEMLDNEDIHLVSICTPSGLHPLHGRQAAAAGKHVLVEKPIGVFGQDAADLIQVCNQARVKLFVVFQNRFNPAIQLMRRAYDEGRFGKLYVIAANLFWTRPQSYYDLSPWRGTWKMDGGAFMNQAAHYMDIIQWFGGPVKSVQAYTATLARQIEAEDSGCAIMQFINGIIGSINVSVLAYPQNLEGSVTILGEKGTVKISGIAMNRIEHWYFADHRDYDIEAQLANMEVESVYGTGHSAYYAGVIESLIDDEASKKSLSFLADGEEAIKSLHMVEQVYGRF